MRNHLQSCLRGKFCMNGQSWEQIPAEQASSAARPLIERPLYSKVQSYRNCSSGIGCCGVCQHFQQFFNSLYYFQKSESSLRALKIKCVIKTNSPAYKNYCFVNVVLKESEESLSKSERRALMFLDLFRLKPFDYQRKGHYRF